MTPRHIAFGFICFLLGVYFGTFQIFVFQNADKLSRYLQPRTKIIAPIPTRDIVTPTATPAATLTPTPTYRYYYYYPTATPKPSL